MINYLKDIIINDVFVNLGFRYVCFFYDYVLLYIFDVCEVLEDYCFVVFIIFFRFSFMWYFFFLK